MIPHLKSPLRWASLPAWGAAAFCCLHAAAQGPIARLETVFPAGLKTGASQEIRISGSNLELPGQLRFSRPGITAEPVSSSPNTYRVTVASTVPPGPVDVQFTGVYGTSNPRALLADERPQLAVSPTNAVPESATRLPVETAATFRVQANQSSWFQFHAAKHQRILVRALTREIDSKLTPNLAVYDAQRRELSRVRRSGLLDFTAPSEGDYLVEVHDQTYRGGDDFACLLLLTTGPHLDMAVPCILEIGRTNRVALYGRNLPGGERSTVRAADGRWLERVWVDLVPPASENPDQAAQDLGPNAAEKPIAGSLHLWSWRMKSGGRSSNPVQFHLTAGRNVSSVSNGWVHVTPPCSFSSFFPGRGAASGITFDGTKDETWWLEVVGERLGQHVDPHVVVQRVQKDDHGVESLVDVVDFGDFDANWGGQEFNTTGKDAMAKLVLPESGTYRVSVRSLYAAGSGTANAVYGLILRRETPGFRLVAWSQPPPKANNDDRSVAPIATFLRRGQTLPVRVGAFRQDGFNGAIELTAKNLPAGVTATFGRIDSGQNAGLILLTAAKDAASASSDIQITGTAAVDGRKLEATALGAGVVFHVPDFNNEFAVARYWRTFPIAVAGGEEHPISVETATDQPFETTAGGKLTIPLKISRLGESMAAFKLKPAGHPAMDKAKEISVAEKGTNATVEINLAETALPEGNTTLWLQGQAAVKLPLPQPLLRNAEAELKAADAELKAASDALGQAKDPEKKAAEERKNKAQERRKAAEERLKPRDATVYVYSKPFTVRIKAATTAKSN